MKRDSSASARVPTRGRWVSVLFACCGLVGLPSLHGACTPTPPGNGDGGSPKVTADAGPGDTPGFEAVIAPVEERPLGETITLDGSPSDTGGRALLIAWIVEPPAGNCAGSLANGSSLVAEFTPACVGEHKARLLLTTADQSASAFAEVTFQVLAPTDPIPNVALEESAWRGFSTTLNGESSAGPEGQTLVYAWSVTPPAGDGCDGYTLANGDSAVAHLTAACAGPHEVTLTLSTTAGASTTLTETLDVRESLVVSFRPLPEVRYGETADIDVVVDLASVPPGVTPELELDVTPVAPATVVPTVINEAGIFRFAIEEPRASYTLLARAFAGDVVSATDAEATLTARNHVPVVENLAVVAEFNIGEAATVTAQPSDGDGDPVTCALEARGANANEITITPVNGEACTFTVQTPAELDEWTVAMTATDGIDTSMESTLTLSPNNLPPVISSVSADDATPGYSCASTTCTATVRVTVSATDDVDAPADLLYDLTDVTTDAPAGVSVEATPVAGTPSAFDVTIQRTALGPMAHTYRLEARATEASSANGMPGSVTQQIDVEVVSAAPVVTTIVADSVNHTYNASTQEYEATLEVSFVPSDPEGNAVSGTVTLLSCPLAGIGTPACGGATLPIATTSTDGSLTLQLSSTSIEALVGGYTFELVATDADGATDTRQQIGEVLNRAPVVASPGALQQQYVSGQHQVSFVLVTDPDGDPLSYDLAVSCPGGASANLPGTCSGGRAFTLDEATGQVTLRGGPADFLGSYQIQGVVTDGATPVGSVGSQLTQFTAANSAPTLSASAAASQQLVCGHTTTSGTVRNATGCRFHFEGDGADPNGDPLVALETNDPADNYSFTFSAPTQSPAGHFSVDYDIQVPFATYKSDFASQPQTARFRVVDPFGATSAFVSVNPTLTNRAPTISSAQFRDSAGTGAPGTLPNNQLTSPSGPSATARVQMGCSTFNGLPVCLQPVTYAFSLVVSASDPDGDPLEVTPSLSCSDANPITDASGASPTTTRALPADGRVALRLPGSVGRCAGGEYYRQWALTKDKGVCQGGSCLYYNPHILCTLSSASSSVSDGLTPTSFASDIDVKVEAVETDLTAVACP